MADLLSIVIVNWNSKELLRKCLHSIRDTCGDIAPQVIVVDGGSFDGCGEMVAHAFPEVEFVQSPDNVGFGRSNNLGFTRVRGEAVLLLNPDTEVTPGAVQRLLSELRRLPRAGIVGPRLLNSDLTLQTSVHALPRPVRQALDSEALRRVLSRFSWWAPPSEFAPPQTVRVEAVSGACMLMWSQVFRQVAGFSPDYFMYAEDMDLCLKVHRAGLFMYHVPDAAIVHHSGASSSEAGSTFSAVMMREALHHYLRVNHGPRSAFSYRVATGLAGIMRMLLMAPGLLLLPAAQRPSRLAALARWRSTVSWSVGLERWVDRYTAVQRPGHS